MPDYGVLRQVTPFASVLLQDNPGPMTLDGTNTWLLRAPDADTTVVVDPGEASDEHLARLLDAAGSIDLVLLTHGHHDHSDNAAAVHEATGAPVRAVDPQWCRAAPPLEDGEAIEAAGLGLRALATPGHSSDSASFVLGAFADGAADAVLTGDTILGRGTTVVAYPDGDLAEYLESLRRLRELGSTLVLTGHGPDLPDLAVVTDFYLQHRAERLEQVRSALASLGPDASAMDIVEVVYADVDKSVWPAAEKSTEAQLEYLRAGN